jgi:hypothetical protein
MNDKKSLSKRTKLSRVYFIDDWTWHIAELKHMVKKDKQEETHI